MTKNAAAAALIALVRANGFILWLDPGPPPVPRLTGDPNLVNYTMIRDFMVFALPVFREEIIDELRKEAISFDPEDPNG